MNGANDYRWIFDLLNLGGDVMMREGDEKMNATVKPIPQKSRGGLTPEKKEILKNQKTISSPIDLNTMREWSKYESD